MRVLSLFDGMACGMLAMQGAGIEVDRYVAYEYDETSANEEKGRPYGYAALTSLHNFPAIEHRGDVFAADFTEFDGIDYLIGGSPCTYWSIAQSNNRETTASGMGWELFSQYVRALNEAKPKYFVYENNKSMSKEIRASIDKAFGFEAVCINSALVSAQNRQRLYWVGRRNNDGSYAKVNVEQPEDRGILLHDILESHIPGSVGVGCRNRREEDGKLYRRFETHNEEKANALTTVQTDSMVAEPIHCYSTPCEWDANGKPLPVYEVKDGRITIKGRQYHIKLADGFYIIRKPTVRECMRLQTVPEWYEWPVSDSQAHKMLGNGWTVDVIAHIMRWITAWMEVNNNG